MARPPKKRKPFGDMKWRDMEKALDPVASRWIRQGSFPPTDSLCWPAHLPPDPVFQYCHILGRKESPILKYDPMNAVRLPRSVHAYFTRHSGLWNAYIEDALPGRLERLLRQDRWYAVHSALLRREDVLIAHRDFYRFNENEDYMKIDWTKYKSPIERAMEELE